MRVLMGFNSGKEWKFKNGKEQTRANFLPETEEKVGSDVVGSAYLHQGPSAPFCCALKQPDEWTC